MDAPAPTDAELLWRFIREADQKAFAQVVHRHIAMVHAAASRQLTDGAMAEDVTQAVFILLARKASRIDAHRLAGWLVKAARYLAMEMHRAEQRRKIREQKAAEMKGDGKSSEHWSQISVLLDEALARVDSTDRTAITLRYLEGRDVTEVAAMMGLSEAATAKRLTRAMSRLRGFFGGRGTDISAGSIGAAMLAHAQMDYPVDLAARSIAAAFAHGATTTAAQLAASKAAAVLVHSWLTATLAAAASSGWSYLVIAIVTIPMAIAGGHAIMHRNTAHVAVTAPSAYVPGPPRHVRVGIMLSQFTATGPYLTSVPYAYKDGYLEMHRALRTDPLNELIPVIEHGTAGDPELDAALKSSFKGEPAIEATNRDQLATLDVIVLPRVWNETPEVVNAIEAAVTSGTGLLIGAGYAMQTPGPADQTNRLNGVTEGCWAMSDPQEVECTILADHPLVGKLAKGAKVNLEPNGECGLLAPGAIPLIQVSDESLIHSIGTTTQIPSKYNLYPLYVSTLGKGKIVNCAFTVWKPPPSDLQNATGGRFMIRCVKWLTNQPLD
jgi:RNA polymerase sigma factor (sigma-70 family)